MIDCYANLVADVDYVECRICKYVCQRLARHVRVEHGISRDDYIESLGPIISGVLSVQTSKLMKVNGSWIARANEKGKDLTEYKKKMGKAVSNAILSNPEELARRSELSRTTITSWAKSEEGRLSSSETAKETSARPEILRARTENLRAWRAREPEAFQEIIHRMIGWGQSKPEKYALEFLQDYFHSYDFRGNQMLISKEHFSAMKTNRRQIDIMSWSKKIIVEIDGPFHFKEIKSWHDLDAAKLKDEQLNVGAVAMGYTVIRIAMDQWKGSNGKLHDDAEQWLIDHIKNAKPGLYRLGKWYYDEPEIEEEATG